MITGGPSGGDSHQARKSQVREAHDIFLREVLDVKAMEDTPLIQFGWAERSGPQTSHNDALVITATLANYEVGRIFIDSGSSADILFGEAYDQMQLGDVFLEKKRNSDEVHKGVPPSKKGKEAVVEGTPEEVEAPAKVRPAEELLNIEIIPGSPDKTTRIGSHLNEKTKEKIVLCLQRNADIFAWALQDLEGIDPKVITHHLNMDPSIKPVKQKKRHFGPEKDKIIQAEVDKLMTT
ncbi:UNVERIFIED_CONTAM: hypothetical protein Slati_1727900 [Sesamum latifolium]|uniref:Reverse transcriptase domain-containing protein n=1 Tax=Sesamum latifolium TaxID=2727402 RepID=A0AAW2WX23_9LAMI